MKKILIPVDFAKHSLEVFEYGLKLADRLEAEIMVLYIKEPGFELQPKTPSISSIFHAKNESSLSDYGEKIQMKLKLNVPSTFSWKEGMPSKVIVNFANNMKVDLILMQSWWSSSLVKNTNSWIGDAGKRVINQTSIPVLLVNPQPKFRKSYNIAYATDFKVKDQRVPIELTTLALAQKAEIFLVHMHNPGSKYEITSYELLQKMQTLLHEKESLQLKIVNIHEERSIPGLNELVELKDIGLVTVLNHEKLSVIERLLGQNATRHNKLYTETPILVLNQDHEQ